MAKQVWVELVIDGKNVGQAFPCSITFEMKIHDLKDAVAMKYQFALTSHSIDAASLLVYPPRTDLSVEGVEAEPLPPYLRLSDPDFPKGIAGPTPLIVTAKSRQQQQQQTHKAVSFTKRWNILYFGTCLPNTHSSRATVTVAADQ
jgi:hypothetical protein